MGAGQSNKVFAFFIPIAPRGQSRARHSKAGMTYTPAKERLEAEKLSALLMAHAPAEPLTGPVAVQIEAVLPIPKSKSVKWRLAAEEGVEKPIGRPDLDNMGKHVLDCMTGVFFVDDKQVTSLWIAKAYGAIPGYHIGVTSLEGL